jgi:hypothetical protein
MFVRIFVLSKILKVDRHYPVIDFIVSTAVLFRILVGLWPLGYARP